MFTSCNKHETEGCEAMWSGQREFSSLLYSFPTGCPGARKELFLQSLIRALQLEAEHAGSLYKYVYPSFTSSHNSLNKGRENTWLNVSWEAQLCWTYLSDKYQGCKTQVYMESVDNDSMCVGLTKSVRVDLKWYHLLIYLNHLCSYQITKSTKI